MINYLKSENYRMLRKQGLYLTTIICYLLLSLAAFVLYAFSKADPAFRYITTQFYYSNAISSGVIIILVGSLYNIALTGKDTSILKQSISFGISRSTIFWSKLFLTTIYFIMVCVFGILLMLILGENLLVTNEDSVRNLLIACVNMAPIVLSGFILTHTLKMLNVSDFYLVFTLFFVYGISGNILRGTLRPFDVLNELYKYTPSIFLGDNLSNYINGTIQLGYEYWVMGIVISVLALLFGVNKFKKLNID